MSSSTILSDNGVTSGSAGIKSTGGSDGTLLLQTTTAGGTATTAVTIDASQNVGISTSSPGAKLDVQTAGVGIQLKQNSAGSATYYVMDNTIETSGKRWRFGYTGAAAASTFSLYNVTDNVTAWVADSSGNLLVGQTVQTTTEKLGITNSGNNDGLYVINGSANPTGYGISSNLTSGTGTVTSTAFLYRGRSNGADRFYVYGNGGIGNFSANNVNLSDRREKTNFAPAKSYLDVICAIPVQTYNYIDQNLETDAGLTLGVVAQDVQVVAPELVTESNWGTEDEPKMRLSIYQTDLQYALMKCIQELKAELDTAKEQIAALQGAAK